MKHSPLLAALLWVTAALFVSPVDADTTALDDYVAQPDPSYSFVRLDTRHYWEGYSIHVVDMTSQQWRSPSEVDRVLWEHELLIAVPWFTHSGNQNTAILIVNGGSNDSAPSTESDDLMGLLAEVTGSVVAMVSQVPNQPLHFADETSPREEDALLAYGMDKYLVSGDPEWLVHLPMTKAVVRALDTVQAFAAAYPAIWPTLPRIDEAIVVGGSKRGWATWLAAAVESQIGETSRVKAVLPASIDLLNLAAQFTHHWEAYGFYAPAVQDYVEFDLPCRVRTPAGRAMLELIDPYAYRARLTMPKLVLNSAGDQFFLPDSSQYYFADLESPKRLRYTLNTDHSQGQDLPNIILPTLSWLSDVLDDKEGPQVDWSLESDGSIRVWVDTAPERVRLWQATNLYARDFRFEAIGPAWTNTELQEAPDGTYVGHVDPPRLGWTAFTVEVTFPGSTLIPTPLESDEIFTTDVRVIPDFLPYAGTACPDYPGSPIWLPESAASVKQNWTTVDAPSGYLDAVVLAGPPTYHGGDPGVVRLRNIDEFGFDLRFQEWDYRKRDFADTYHASEDIPYMVLQPGHHLMSDGSEWEVGTFSLWGTGIWQRTSFVQQFTAPPHLFLTAQTYNGGQAISVRARSLTTDDFEAALFEEEALMDGHAIETIGYLAISSPVGGGLIDIDGTRVSYLLQSLNGDERWNPVLSQRIKVEEEGSRDSEVDHVDETLHMLALGSQILAQQVTSNGGDTTALRRLEPTRDAPMEWGLLRGVDHTWQVLPFARTYTDPVVIAKPVSNQDSDPGVIRLKGLTASGAQLRYEEWDYLDDIHVAPEDLFYLVSEAGEHALGGLAIEADSLVTNKLGRAGQWESIPFSTFYTSTPSVFASVLTYNGTDTVTTRIRNLDPATFELAMDEQESKSDGHTNETLGWIAIETGSTTTSEGRKLQVFFDQIDHNVTIVAYPSATSHRTPTVLGDIDSTFGGDPVFLRYTDPTHAQIKLKLTEEQSKDTETAHVREDVGVFVAE